MNRFAVYLILCAVPAFGAETTLSKDEIASAVRIDSLTIPTPGEFFSAMDAAGRPAWGQYVRTTSPSPSDSRVLIALVLGTYVADGYVAVEAQDGQSVKNIGKEIIALAKKLNASQSVLGRANSINDFADNNDWNALREELESTQNEVKLDMVEQKDDRLVILIKLGAWIRGVELVSGIVAGNYTPQSARLLRQPAIIRYLLDRIQELPESTREDPAIVTIRKGLQSSLAFVSDPTPSLEQALSLHRQMQDLEAVINAQKP